MEGKKAKKVGQYLVSSQMLGQGAFSTVYLAFDHKQKPLAVKVFPLSNIRCTMMTYSDEQAQFEQ